MVTVYEVIGDCECFTHSFKNDIVETLNDIIIYEGDILDKLKYKSPKWEFVAEKQSDHEELLKYIRPMPTCGR